jgi:hypothetical protein
VPDGVLSRNSIAVDCPRKSRESPVRGRYFFDLRAIGPCRRAARPDPVATQRIIGCVIRLAVTDLMWSGVLVKAARLRSRQSQDERDSKGCMTNGMEPALLADP